MHNHNKIDEDTGLPDMMLDVERLTALLQINDYQICFELDTGANVDTICKKIVRKEQVKTRSGTLTMWNKSTIHVAGETTLDIVNCKC